MLADDKRFYFEAPDSVGDNITASAYGERGDIHLRIEEPWAGSTETGFGAICGLTLPRETAIELAQWILKATTSTTVPRK